MWLANPGKSGVNFLSRSTHPTWPLIIILNGSAIFLMGQLPDFIPTLRFDFTRHSVRGILSHLVHWRPCQLPHQVHRSSKEKEPKHVETVIFRVLQESRLHLRDHVQFITVQRPKFYHDVKKKHNENLRLKGRALRNVLLATRTLMLGATFSAPLYGRGVPVLAADG